MTKRKWKCACGRCYGATNALLASHSLAAPCEKAVMKEYPKVSFIVQHAVHRALQPVRGGMDAIAEVLRESPRPPAFSGLQAWSNISFTNQMMQMLNSR